MVTIALILGASPLKRKTLMTIDFLRNEVKRLNLSQLTLKNKLCPRKWRMSKKYFSQMEVGSLKGISKEFTTKWWYLFPCMPELQSRNDLWRTFTSIHAIMEFTQIMNIWR